MQVKKEEIGLKGKRLAVDSVRIDNRIVILNGTIIKIARIKDEWFEDVENPESIINSLKSLNKKPDIFTFWQRPPDIIPKYNYHMELESISAIPIRSYEYWWTNQIGPEIRKNIRKAERKGVEVKIIDFNDDLVKGIVSIYNEKRIRQGTIFWHYGKDFATVKAEVSRDLDKCDFIGAYFNGELIGFFKLVYGDKLVQPVLSIAKMAHSSRKATSLLIAKAVEICDSKKIPYFTYGAWRHGSHASFLQRHGYEKIDLPRWYVPLTVKGKIVLKIGAHRGLKEMIPETIKEHLLKLRAHWYRIKYGEE